MEKRYVITISLVIILGFLVSSFLLFYNPQNVSAKEYTPQEYKKALYDSFSCQYSCPLAEQEYQGRVQLLPSRECTQNCIDNYNSLEIDSSKFTQQELLQDNLAGDVGAIVDNCRAISTSQDGEINNEDFFACTTDGLESLKEDYKYLN